MRSQVRPPRPFRLAAGVLLVVGLGCNGLITGHSGPGSGAGPGGVGGDGGVSGPGGPGQAACALPGARIVKLTPAQYDATVGAAIGGYPCCAPGSSFWSSTVGSSAGAFTNESTRKDMTQLHVSRIFAGSRWLAQLWTADGSRLYQLGNRTVKDPTRYQCRGILADDASPDETCIRGFVRDWGAQMFRRPLTTEELDGYLGFFRQETTSFGSKVGFEQMVHALAMSPHVLYRTELGGAKRPDGTVELTAYEKAQALSYFLTDGPPDAALQAAAASDALSTPEQISAQTRRLFGTQPTFSDGRPNGAAGVVQLLREYFEYGQWESAKGWLYGARIPTWNGAVGNYQIPNETERFLLNVLWEDDAKVSTVFTASYSMLTGALAAHYGIPYDGDPKDQTTFKKTALPAGQRMGLLTQLSFLARFGKLWSTDIVHRGKYIREKFLCGTIPPPPALPRAAIPPARTDDQTQRQAIAAHSTDPACASCHRLMDPVGFPFESFDTIGRFRARDDDYKNGSDVPRDLPLQLDGELKGLASGDVPVKDAFDLSRTLATLPDVRQCIARNFYQYAQARVAASTDGCALSALAKAFDASGGDMRALLVEVTTSPDFSLRSSP